MGNNNSSPVLAVFGSEHPAETVNFGANIFALVLLIAVLWVLWQLWRRVKHMKRSTDYQLVEVRSDK